MSSANAEPTIEPENNEQMALVGEVEEFVFGSNSLSQLTLVKTTSNTKETVKGNRMRIDSKVWLQIINGFQAHPTVAK